MNLPPTVTPPSFDVLAGDSTLLDLQRQLEECKIIAQAACENANAKLQAVADVLKAMCELRDWALMQKEFYARHPQIQ